MQDRDADLELLTIAAREAGRIAFSFFKRDPKAWTKDGNSPVTEADIAVDRYLFEVLTGARPDYGWLSEETADTSLRLQRRRVFVVDPIDGTRGFIAGKPDWCVSVAVVEDSLPVVGVLDVPAHGEFFAAVASEGAILNGMPIFASGRETLKGARMSGPTRHLRAFGAEGLDLAERRHTPSLAYRFALVAAGRLDIASATPDANDWDLAAADLLVHEAGAVLGDLTGAGLRYNRPEPRHPALIAATPKLAKAAASIVAAAESDAERIRLRHGL